MLNIISLEVILISTYSILISPLSSNLISHHPILILHDLSLHSLSSHNSIFHHLSIFLIIQHYPFFLTFHSSIFQLSLQIHLKYYFMHPQAFLPIIFSSIIIPILFFSFFLIIHLSLQPFLKIFHHSKYHVKISLYLL